MFKMFGQSCDKSHKEKENNETIVKCNDELNEIVLLTPVNLGGESQKEEYSLNENEDESECKRMKKEIKSGENEKINDDPILVRFGIEELRKQVDKDEQFGQTVLLRNSEFIGLFGDKCALLQLSDSVYSISWTVMLRELNYQLYLDLFGSYGFYEIPEEFGDCREHLNMFFLISSRWWPKKISNFAYVNPKSCIDKLVNHREQLSELSIEITQDGKISKLPALIEAYQPNMLYLGEFLAQLANLINYHDHGEFIRLVGRILAQYYTHPLVPCVNTNIKNKIIWSNFSKHVLFPKIKKSFKYPNYIAVLEPVFKMKLQEACRSVGR